MLHGKRLGTAVLIVLLLINLCTVVHTSAKADQDARSAMVGNDIFLEGKYLSVGISGSASFGTASSAPAGFHPTPYYGGEIGLSVDQDGFDTGNPPTTGDFFLPGTPEERFNVGFKIAGKPFTYTNAEQCGDVDIPRESSAILSSGSTLSARWTGIITTGGSQMMRITQTVEFQADQKFFRTAIQLQNIGGTTLDSVRYMRNVDPDQDRDLNGTFTTINDVLDQQPADGKALVRAEGLVTKVPIFYYSSDPRARVSTFGFSNSDPYDPAAYDQAGVYNYYNYIDARGSLTEDQAISICVDLGTLKPGETGTPFIYYTSLDADFDKVLQEIEDEDAIPVTVLCGDHGTITPGTGNVPFGSSPVYTITPGRGYLIDSLTVDGISVPDALHDVHAYQLTLNNVTAPHTIQASFRMIDTEPPVIKVPAYNLDSRTIGAKILTFSVGGGSYDLKTDITDDSGVCNVSIFDNGHIVGMNPSQNGIQVYHLTLAEMNTMKITAVDGAGNESVLNFVLHADSAGPVIHLDKTLATTVHTDHLTISGQVSDSSGLRSLLINGEPATVYADGTFAQSITLLRGSNDIILEAADTFGNVTHQEYTVEYTPLGSSPVSDIVVLTIGSSMAQINGMPVAMDAAPVIKNGRTLLPIRALMEAIGGSASWDAKAKMVTVKLGDRTVVLTIGKNTALVNGKQTAIDPSNAKVVPEIMNGRTYLPLRFIAENIGLDLTWDAASQTISFTYWP